MQPSPPSPPDGPRERGLLIILSSPSGAGKTTLARRLLAEFPGIEFSISYTTRPPRGSERDGVDYHFVDRDTFEAMVERGELAEWAVVHDNLYGTARATVEAALAAGRDVVFDIDWQGGRSLSQKWPDDALRVFIMPPDLATLEARLRGRNTDAEPVIARRLARAREEMSHHPEYHYVIVNDDLERAYALLRAVYLIHRLGTHARPDDSHALDELALLVAKHTPDHRRRAQAMLEPAGRGEH